VDDGLWASEAVWFASTKYVSVLMFVHNLYALFLDDKENTIGRRDLLGDYLKVWGSYETSSDFIAILCSKLAIRCLPRILAPCFQMGSYCLVDGNSAVKDDADGATRYFFRLCKDVAYEKCKLHAKLCL
jgi:hypothetical protein